jgi:putative acetyltransferase
MFTLQRTNSDNPHFKTLVKLLDNDLQLRDGDEHAFYAQFNKIDTIKNAVVCFVDDIPVGIGAYRKYDENTVEIKRMYVQPEYRGKGYANEILHELEKWATQNNYTSALLETGKKQPEAIALYKKSGYEIILSYGQYLNVENSVCMMKKLQ